MNLRYLVCSVCNNFREITSPHKHRKGHMKHMYCFTCKKETMFREIPEEYEICEYCQGRGYNLKDKYCNVEEINFDNISQL